MKFWELLQDAGNKMIYNFWIYILLSLVITASVMASVFMLVYMKNLSMWFYLLIFICLFISALFTVYTISFTLKEKPLKKGTTIIATAMWSVLFTIVGVVFRHTLHCGINKLICYISFGVFAWLLGGAFVLSMCCKIKGEKQSVLKLVLQNKKMCAMLMLSLGIFTCLVIYAALGSAIPHSRFNSFATYEGIKLTERRWLCLSMVAFIPLYVLTFVSLYEHTIANNR